jgi:glucokinase
VRSFPVGAAIVTAESWTVAAKGTANAISLWIGERVFAGLLIDGRPWTGAHGQAGAAAWLALNPVERQDYRKLGSLAAEVGVKGIARRLSWRIQAGDHSAVLERAGDLDAITATHVFEGARAGDGVAISVVRDTAKYIGMAVANLAAAVDPDVVVIGGPVSAASDLLADAVRQETGRRLPGSMDHLRVEFSTLGDEAVAIGAARLAMTGAAE